MEHLRDAYDLWEDHEAKLEREAREHVIGYCAVCDEAVYDDSDYFDVNGELVHFECLGEWAEQFRVNKWEA